MSVADARWLFNCPRDIVIRPAQFVGEQLNLVRRFLDFVIDHREARRGRHTLTRSHRHQIELVGVLVSDRGVNYRASLWIHKSAGVSCEEACIDPLARVYVHELGLASLVCACDRSLDLLDFRRANSLDLTFAHAVTVEDNLLRITAIVFLESLKSAAHACLQICGPLLPNLILNHTR